MNKIKTFLLLVAIIGSVYIATAQDRKEKFNAFLYTDGVATTKDGFNIGGGVEYSMTTMYFKSQIFVFPNLNGKTYTELTGVPLGFNWWVGEKDRYRLFGGTKMGFIFRDSNTYPTIGVDFGLDYNINEIWFIGFAGDYMLRQDGRIWSYTSKDYWRLSGFVRFGYRW